VNVEALHAIRKTVVVPASVERSWEVFTERIGEWWPFASHSLGGSKTETAFVTPELIYERWQDGTERTWGHVLAWEPPHRLVFTWEVGEDSGNEIEVRFLREGDGTRVELEHRGWEEGTADAWSSYDAGWAGVLGCYEAAAR